jgi:Bacterial protein of unknown function (DUF899)
MENPKSHLPTNTPPIVSPQEWEAARQQLLVKEKAVTRARDISVEKPVHGCFDPRSVGIRRVVVDQSARRAASGSARLARRVGR